jgi:uncharacterized membrane protein YdjX (TVP38/TMEM64 family)
MAAGAEPIDEKPAAEDVVPTAEAKPGWRGVLLLAVATGVLFALIYLSPLHGYMGRVRDLSDQLQRLGWLAPVVFTSSVALLVALGFPRLFFCVLAGMALGFWQGLLWAQLGTLLGNYIVFGLARSWMRDWAKQYLYAHRRLRNALEQDGIAGVILARQLPLPGLFINLTCGLFSIGRREFLIGTLLGQLPEAIPCTLIGAGLLQASFKRSLGLISLGIGSAVLVWLALRQLLRRRKNVL